ncbi:MAG: SiaB family protein kinase [Bacteroidota bacterium]|nr:SiaB family protein kinase [Candidatus Kapabacteria bacterium]MDW8220476.1 SiaB family protein kinase [Bacteroidota bacterium]
MDFETLANYYTAMTDKGIIMSFQGALAQSIIVEIGQTLRRKISAQHNESLSERTKLVKHVFAIFVELAQNIMLYSAEQEIDISGKHSGVGLLVVSETHDRYCISSANRILREQREHLCRRCESLQSLSKEELRRQYNERRRLPRSTDKGAGLGLIEIARRSDSPLSFACVPLPEHTHALFMLSAYIDKPRHSLSSPTI